MLRIFRTKKIPESVRFRVGKVDVSYYPADKKASFYQSSSLTTSNFIYLDVAELEEIVSILQSFKFEEIDE